MSAKTLRHENYTVGWICPLEIEHRAAIEMLDEEHEALSQSPVDHNVYTLGSIGGHNVVISGLFTPGNNAAATVVAQMRNTFQGLRFALLVGIGGGVPTESDSGLIRLGDVVVSKPADQHSGAVQYDHGKLEVGQFKLTGYLTPPPAVLLNAAQVLAINRFRKNKDPIMENVKRINTDKRDLRKYRYPGIAEDRLYDSNYEHQVPRVPCNKCGCDPTRLILREIDEDDGNDPRVVVHRGTIASGEKVIKNGALRDQLAKEHGVLCFEMEAAGALADFPCIVIRGISDYCDSHKNDQWHGYSAAAAAAYARQLFFHMPINEEKRYISSATEDNINKLVQRGDDQDRRSIADWLTPVDYAPQQSDFISKRQEGTGQWLLDSKEFNEWLGQSNQTLFCQGMPGAGKTIITSIVVHRLHTVFWNNSTIGIAYLYCSFGQRHEQKPTDLLLSLLKQLIQERSFIPQIVKDLYTRHKDKRTRPLFDEISEALHSAVAQYSKVFVIIDAMDEFQVSNEDWRTFLTDIFNLQTKTAVNIFATSRFIPEIEMEFEGSIPLEIRASSDDVQRYLEGHMSRLPLFVSRNVDLQEEIKTAIVEAVDGMFLLAQLHLVSLIGKRSPKAIKVALKGLPIGSEGYNSAYNEAMKRIESQSAGSKELAIQVLSWITCTKRRLTTSEARHALAVEIGASELDKENLPEIEDMVSVCAGLVTVDEESDIIRLIHHTTQEYFERTQKDWFPSVQTDIATTCVTYLSFDTFETGFCLTDKEFEARLQLNPLYDYATRNWGHHARAASAEVEQSAVDFLKSEAKVSGSIQAMMASSNHNNPGYSQKVPKQVTGLHLTAYFGLREAGIVLLKNGYDPDSKDDYNEQTPLSWAAENGHEAVVKLLLATGGVEVNSKDDRGQTPLSWAAENGHEAVVKLLLATGGVEVNSKDDRGQTPLSWAAKNGHEAVIKLLFATGGVEVNSKDKKGQTPLLWAAENGHEAVVKLLLATDGVEVKSKNDMGQTPLSWAAKNGHEAVVTLLLAKDGVDVDSKDNKGLTPLWLATERGHEAVVKLLLAKGGVDVNSKDENDMTPLSLAAMHENERLAKLLLSEDSVDLNSNDEDGRTPLSWAAFVGNERVVKLLISEDGVDLNSKDTKDGRAPLWWAVRSSQEAVAKLLLAKDGVEPDSKDNRFQTPLIRAAANGHEGLVKLLLTKDGVNPNSKDKYGLTPLSWAAWFGHKEVAELLLAKDGVILNPKDIEQGLTPLSMAAANGHEAVVELLLAKDGVDLNSKDIKQGRMPLPMAAANEREEVMGLLPAEDGDNLNSKDIEQGRTSLSMAAANGHEKVTELLLAKDGVDLNPKDTEKGRTPLSLATASGHEAVMELFLAKDGVDLNPKDTERGRTPLSLAAANGHEAVVELLLAKGGVDLNPKDIKQGRTPLSIAAANGHEAVVELLLAKDGVDLNPKNTEQGCTPLSMAAANGHKAVVELLLAKDGVDLNPKDIKQGRTPLSIAAANGHKAVVELLLAKDGVDPNPKDTEQGRTPLSLAVANGHKAVVELLLAKKVLTGTQMLITVA